jgi:hypothetical protein
MNGGIGVRGVIVPKFATELQDHRNHPPPASKSGLSALLFASPVGSAITAPLNPSQDAESWFEIVAGSLKIWALSVKCRLRPSRVTERSLPRRTVRQVGRAATPATTTSSGTAASETVARISVHTAGSAFKSSTLNIQSETAISAHRRAAA